MLPANLFHYLLGKDKAINNGISFPIKLSIAVHKSQHTFPVEKENLYNFKSAHKHSVQEIGMFF